VDKLSPQRRSENMRRIRSKDTKPEILVRKLLHRNGLRFILHDRRLPGIPDIVLPKFRAAIQVRGCFWHGHSCIDGHIPKTRASYWMPKILGNKRRDVRNDHKLRRLRWRLMVVWECQCVGTGRMKALLKRISRFVGYVLE
jgi:DNA mismatch endonuclease (patch repair protein)